MNLLEEGSFRAAGEIEADVPIEFGVYAIRLRAGSSLPAANVCPRRTSYTAAGQLIPDGIPTDTDLACEIFYLLRADVPEHHLGRRVGGFWIRPGVDTVTRSTPLRSR